MTPFELDATTEWQECRQTIARFDGFLANTRMYGFTLVTVLLTANALVTTNPAVDRAAASIVVMALLLALFMIDNFYWALLLAAVGRAIEIETTTKTHISGALSVRAGRSHSTALVLSVYDLFVLVAAGIAFVAVLTSTPVAVGGLVALSAAVLIELAAMHAIYELVEHPGSPFSSRFWALISRIRPSSTADPASKTRST